ncbi:hypothetical protein IW261DRAFT_766431 [Armillaria novae-zelandiae]|uniref:Ribonuclease H1 N-terminal domain-containing protein n=1 Tax=Armillaria novae-zelandiae TaxID=153914 RepID=A0AA39PM08_9AGAR|nr:hypothetical protein IW261DRAFT_766431 [Armillaria novae-zelandiae]
MARRKWYAVTAGRAVGLFDNWLLVAPLVIGVSESHYVSFTSEEDAWQAYEEAKDEGNIRILPSGAGTAQPSRSHRMGGNTSRNDEHRPPTNPTPSQGRATNSGRTVSNSTAVTSPETVTLVGGNSSSRPLSHEGASSSRAAAAPHLPPSRRSSSRGATPSPAPSTRSTNTDSFVRLYLASSSKTKSRSASSSTSCRDGLDRNPPKLVLPRAKRVIVREPSFLRPYPDEPESSEDDQAGVVSSGGLLSPLASPRLQTPELYEGPSSPSAQNERSRQSNRHGSPASLMSAMGLAPSQATGVPTYDTVADPRSPFAKTTSIPRDTNRASGRPSPNYSLYGGALLHSD